MPGASDDASSLLVALAHGSTHHAMRNTPIPNLDFKTSPGTSHFGVSDFGPSFTGVPVA